MLPTTSTSNPDNAVPDVPISINVNFGRLRVTAVVSSLGLSIMNEKVYRKIEETSPMAIVAHNKMEAEHKFVYDVFDHRYEVLKNAEMDLILAQQLVPVSILVIKDLPIDLALGRDFVKQIKPVFHLGASFFKWCGRRLNMIPFVEDKQSLVAISNRGNEPEIIIAEFHYKRDPNEVQSTKKKNPFPIFEFDGDMERRMEENLAKISQEHEKSMRESDLRVAKKLRRHARRNAERRGETQDIALDEDDDDDDGTPWAKIFVTDKFTIDKNGDAIGYYAIWWIDSHESNYIVKINLGKTRTTFGLHFEALFQVFEEAIFHSIDDKLHIVSDNEEAIVMLNDYYYGDVTLPHKVSLPGENDYSSYVTLCMVSENYVNLKLEYVSQDDYPQMMKLRKMLDEGILAFE